MDYELWMMLLDISNSRKIKLIKEYKSCKNVYDNFEDIIKKDTILEKKFIGFEKDDLIPKVISLKKLIKEKNMSYITYTNSRFTDKLDNISPPPFFLFYRGNIDILLTKSIAIVGSRKCSNYGLLSTKVLTKELITNNITLISGGAYGIDSEVHKNALNLDGRNICVLGCGIDIAYPKRNLELFNQLEKKDLIISEFLPGTMPLKSNFPVRNRIISGLSDMTIVIEAAEKSGSLITARLALEDNKTVIVVPGSMFNSGSKGSNSLLETIGVRCCSDIDTFREIIKSRYIEIEPLIKDPHKQEVIDLLSDSPLHIDQIFDSMSVDRGKLYALLFEMQVKGELTCLPGNYYAKLI